MARPLWKGVISFGLVNMPVVLYPAESNFDLHFHLLDSRDHARVRYSRINAETGLEVPWEDVVKAYEYEKGEYVVIKDGELENLAVKNAKTIEIEDFVDTTSIDSVYFNKPYYLVPDKRGEKAYVLLRETLKATKKTAIAKIMLRTKEYLAAVIPYHYALAIILLRYDQELRKLTEFDIPSDDIKHFKITSREIDLAKQLVDSMTRSWQPSHYHDDYQIAVKNWLEEQIDAKDKPTHAKSKHKHSPTVKTNVVDIMSLLKKSLAKKSTSKKEPIKAKVKKISSHKRAK